MSKIKIAVAAIAAVGTAIGTALGIKVYRDNNRYDKYGYNKKGYNKSGYDKEGYNKEGYDKQGYNAEGYDKHGYDAQGYDKYGFDSYGYNADGYDIYGYNRDGFDVNGYDRRGYDGQGYNAEGKNRTGKAKEELLKKAEDYLMEYRKACEDDSKKDYRIACVRCRTIVSSIMKNILEHYGHDCTYYDPKDGKEKCIKHSEMIDNCYENNLIDDETKNKLHQLRTYGNDAVHEDINDLEIMPNQCYFVIRTTEEMIELFKEKLYLL